MLNKLFKTNIDDHVNIWVKKSKVKIGKEKTILVEVVAPDEQFYMFFERNVYEQLIVEPIGVLDLISIGKHKDLKDIININGSFYFNGKLIKVKE